MFETLNVITFPCRLCIIKWSIKLIAFSSDQNNALIRKLHVIDKSYFEMYILHVRSHARDHL